MRPLANPALHCVLAFLLVADFFPFNRKKLNRDGAFSKIGISNSGIDQEGA